MKQYLRSIVAGSLALLARLIIQKYHPTIVMVTGSVGKTSTKDAIAAALKERAYLRASEKSHNSEFGVPFTVIGVKNPWESPLSWARVYREAFALLILPNHYPKILVLEVGADRPGDLAKILRIATPHAVVVTRLPEVPVHVEAYASAAAVRDEEFVPAYGLAPGSPLVIASQDAYAKQYAARIPAALTTYGFSSDADIRVEQPRVWEEEGRVVGMEAALFIEGAEFPLRVRGSLGKPQLLAPAAAVAIATQLGFSIKDALAGLAHYAPPPGRSGLLRGVKDTVLLDDTYNASPAAVEEALAALKSIPAKRHVAVLGDMLELGRYSVAEHERIGTLVAEYADVLVAVGIRSRALAEAARKAGMKDDAVIPSDNAAAAAELMPRLIEEGDAVLIKGSQSVRAERITEALLANPADAVKLVRQEKEWKRIR